MPSTTSTSVRAVKIISWNLPPTPSQCSVSGLVSPFTLMGSWPTPIILTFDFIKAPRCSFHFWYHSHLQQDVVAPVSTRATTSTPAMETVTINQIGRFCQCWSHDRPNLAPLAPSGTLWQHLAPSGTLWHHLAPSGTIWHSLALYGTLWHHLAPSGTLWHPFASSGTLWHPLTPSGTLWHYLALSVFLPSACSKQLYSAEQLDMPSANAPFLNNTSSSASSKQISAARFVFVSL